MHVILAGYNVDREVIEELKKSSPSREDVLLKPFLLLMPVFPGTLVR